MNNLKEIQNNNNKELLNIYENEKILMSKLKY